MKTKQIQIKGMHCRSCEILVEDELMKIKGVRRALVNHKTGVAHLECDCEVGRDEVDYAVQSAGYSLGVDSKRYYFSKDIQDYKDLGMAFLIVFNLYMIARYLGVFNLGGLTGSNYSSLPVVFLVGLTAGVSTCMALVGGLVLGASARFAAKNPTASSFQKFVPHIFFNLGRVVAYFVLGGVLGLVGSFFQLSTSVLGLLTIGVGLVMILLGGQLIDIFPFLKRISFTLPKGISRMLGIKPKLETEYSNKSAAAMGASTFFLPCGFTQAMQLFAISSGSPATGALTMGVFALGTAPGLLGVGGLGAIIKGAGAKLFFKTAGVIVILLALFNIVNGLNLMGIPQVLGAFSPTNKPNLDAKNVTIKDGVQIVRMTQDSSGYSPNKFTIKKGLPVKWIVTSTDPYSCASSIVSQKLGIRKMLRQGENVFEFTPKETGTIRFSCSMGMFVGTFNVVN